MKLKFYFLIQLIITSILIVSCQTFPTEQLSLNLSDEKQPIMLNKEITPQKTKSFDFKAGYTSQSLTSANSGGYGGSTTVTESHTTNDNFSKQLNNIFIQNPEWILVSSLYINAKRGLDIGIKLD